MIPKNVMISNTWKIKIMKIIIVIAAMLFFGCGEEDENRVCETTVTCEDDKEMFCDDPVTVEFEDGTSLEVRACTYATYEHCFEKTEYRPQ